MNEDPVKRASFGASITATPYFESAGRELGPRFTIPSRKYLPSIGVEGYLRYTT